jgi:prepilin-type N-terminal cleavage/methylation domain-containing protein
MHRSGWTLVEVLVVVLILLIVVAICIPLFVGVGGMGPTNTVTATINRMYIDVSGGGEDSSTKSHYMVATDQGVYEVGNGWLLGVWNADEIYGKLKVGGKYEFTTKGRKIANFFMQEYPYIVKVVEVSNAVPVNAVDNEKGVR